MIDDARARHRRERWAGAIIAAVAVGIGLLFGLGGGGGGSGTRGHGQSGGAPAGAGHSSSQPLAMITGRGISASEFGLLSPRVGWAVLRNGFYITHDGGLRWAALSVDTRQGGHYGNRSVPGFGLRGDFTANIMGTTSPSPRVVALGLVDGRAGSSCTPPRSPATGAGVVLLSADAGRRWSTHLLPGCDIPDSVSFVNAGVGYAALSLPGADSKLYRTVDGARHWSLVSRFDAPMTASFGNERDGLAFVTPNTKDAAAVLYRTTDAGRRWRRLRICGDTPDPTSTVYCDAPTSFGRTGLVLAIAQNLAKAHGDRAYLYTTADAGRHWIRHAVPPLDSPEMPAFSAPNARDIFLYSLGGVLHTSSDGGRRWHSIRLPAFRNLSQMQFVSARYGWILAGGHFDYTTDGGRRWRPVGIG